MRTTLTLEPDVAAELDRRRRKHNRSLKEEVNHLLRLGLRQADAGEAGAGEPFATETAKLGRLLIDVRDVEDALASAEGDDRR